MTMPKQEREQLMSRLASIHALLNDLERICRESIELRSEAHRTHEELARIAERLRPISRGLFGEPEPD